MTAAGVEALACVDVSVAGESGAEVEEQALRALVIAALSISLVSFFIGWVFFWFVVLPSLYPSHVRAGQASSLMLIESSYIKPLFITELTARHFYQDIKKPR